MVENTAKARAAGLDKYFSAVYGRPMKMAAMLEGLGYPPAALDTLYRVHLDALVEQVVAGIEAQVLQDPDGVRLRYAVMRRFGLDGAPPAALYEIGDALGVSRERARQFVVRAIRRRKTAHEIARLREILSGAADSCLGGRREG